MRTSQTQHLQPSPAIQCDERASADVIPVVYPWFLLSTMVWSNVVYPWMWSLLGLLSIFK